MRPLRVVVLDEELPYPLTSGKRIRTFQLLRRLAARHRIRFVCHRNADAGEIPDALRAFADAGIETRVVDRAVPGKTGPAFYMRLGANLLSPLPYSVASHTSAALTAAVREEASDGAVDLWHCEWTPYAETLRRALGPADRARNWVVMAHNVESRIWERTAAAQTDAIRRWYVARQWKKFERFERWAYSSAGRAIAVSREDAALMAADYGASDPAVVDNGVDVAYFTPRPDTAREPATLLFLGSLDWRPNQDAVQVLLDSVFPRVRAEAAGARLLLVGRRPPESLRRRVSSEAGVALSADVPDVRPYLASCGMLVVPLRIGGGSRLKILEALAMETPVVSTRIGAEGLELTAGRDLIAVASPDEMARAVLDAIRDPEGAQRTAVAGRARVLGRYAWEMLADRLEAVWRESAAVTDRDRDARPR